MNIPNSLTLVRIVLVPLVVWLIITHEMTAAFLLFLAAGMSDAADGFVAIAKLEVPDPQAVGGDGGLAFDRRRAFFLVLALAQ